MIKIKKSRREIKYIVIHCTATKEGYDIGVKRVRKWHTGKPPRGRGWSDVGYNYLVRLNGEIELGRDVDKIPAHVRGYNRNSIGIVYVGGLDDDMNPKDTRTRRQKDILESLVEVMKEKYPEAEVLGHRDFPGVRKACPCFDAKKEYN